MPFCTSCGAEVNDGDGSCWVSGAAQGPSQQTSALASGLQPGPPQYYSPASMQPACYPHPPAYFQSTAPPESDPAVICPYRQERGHRRIVAAKMMVGISGGKATAAVLIAG
jgi:hypothetical protein